MGNRGTGVADRNSVSLRYCLGRCNIMLNNANNPERTLSEILESLMVKEESYDTFYQTRSREDYDKLLDAALSGDLEGVIAVGHTAIYRDKLRVNPPSKIAN